MITAEVTNSTRLGKQTNSKWHSKPYHRGGLKEHIILFVIIWSIQIIKLSANHLISL